MRQIKRKRPRKHNLRFCVALPDLPRNEADLSENDLESITYVFAWLCCPENEADLSENDLESITRFCVALPDLPKNEADQAKTTKNALIRLGRGAFARGATQFERRHNNSVLHLGSAITGGSG